MACGAPWRGGAPPAVRRRGQPAHGGSARLAGVVARGQPAPQHGSRRGPPRHGRGVPGPARPWCPGSVRPRPSPRARPGPGARRGSLVLRWRGRGASRSAVPGAATRRSAMARGARPPRVPFPGAAWPGSSCLSAARRGARGAPTQPAWPTVCSSRGGAVHSRRGPPGASLAHVGATRCSRSGGAPAWPVRVPRCGLMFAFGVACVWLACPRLARVCPTASRGQRGSSSPDIATCALARRTGPVRG
jgi:hypothetical protein